MILATTKVEDFDRFVEIFSTKGAEKRKQHGSKGSSVFRDPNEDDRVWVLFDWDESAWPSGSSTRQSGSASGGGARRSVRRLARPRGARCRHGHRLAAAGPRAAFRADRARGGHQLVT